MILLLALTVAGMTPAVLLNTAFSALVKLFGLYAIPFIATKLPGVTKMGFDWLTTQSSHVKNQFVAGVLARASTLVEQKVLAYENTQVEYLKEQVSNGKFTRDQLPVLLNEMKNRLVTEVKADASATNLLADLHSVFGNNVPAFESWLSSLVETHVANLPPSGLQTKL